jgi:hypothetical protein
MPNLAIIGYGKMVTAVEFSTPSARLEHLDELNNGDRSEQQHTDLEFELSIGVNVCSRLAAVFDA